MGVEFEQHPDLWNAAVIIEVPLLDMLRFEKIAAGRKSWVGEYGSVSDTRTKSAFLEKISPYSEPKVAGVALSRALHLHHDQGRSRRPAARTQIRSQDGVDGHLPYLLYYEAIEGGHSVRA